MAFHRLIHGLQYEIHLQGFAQHPGQKLFRAGIDDSEQVAARCLAIGDVSDIAEQDSPGAVGFKLPVQQDGRHIGRLDRLGHVAVRVCLPNEVSQPVFSYQPPDLFDIRYHWRIHVDEPHIDPMRTFLA